MIKFIASSDDEGVVIGLGLSEGNVERLKNGQPIKILLKEELGMPLKGSLMIFYGKTEEDIMADLQPFIGPGTQIHLPDQEN